RKFRGMKVGGEVDASFLGLSGCTIKITGGSDKCGFPMRRGVHSTKTLRVLLRGGVGYNPTENVRRKRRVRGEEIGEDIVQINTKIVKKGKKSIEQLLGLEAEQEKTEEKPGEEKKEVKEAEQKPKEEKTEKAEEKKVKAEEKGKKEKPEEEEKETEKKEEKTLEKEKKVKSKSEKEKKK
ncbi:MAG: hypothetical protein KAU03_00895, partial [Candidatus Altiarchaeales archaeon]|nr:hypothetical protein [Candidatus Altiarchaeales archaeon]